MYRSAVLPVFGSTVRLCRNHVGWTMSRIAPGGATVGCGRFWTCKCPRTLQRDYVSLFTENTDHLIPLTDRALRMLWSKSRLSHQITRMQQRGLVDREEHPADG